MVRQSSAAATADTPQRNVPVQRLSVKTLRHSHSAAHRQPNSKSGRRIIFPVRNGKRRPMVSRMSTSRGRSAGTSAGRSPSTRLTYSRRASSAAVFKSGSGPTISGCTGSGSSSPVSSRRRRENSERRAPRPSRTASALTASTVFPTTSSSDTERGSVSCSGSLAFLRDFPRPNRRCQNVGGFSRRTRTGGAATVSASVVVSAAVAPATVSAAVSATTSGATLSATVSAVAVSATASGAVASATVSAFAGADDSVANVSKKRSAASCVSNVSDE